ncbi:MAG: ADP-ribosylglycohydrolase family protein, partial [Flavobacteriaceae bacterium]|nr:ADP-ribosylglycohydrolase family protein [Flavobacteriaceae bacterium]
MKNKLFQILFIYIFLSCNTTINDKESYPLFSKKINITEYIPSSNDIVVNRLVYKDKLEGFWLGQCIANWTGLITEMDKIGNIGEIKTGDFYTRDDWGKKDLPNIWNIENNIIENRLIDFVLRYPDETWGSD